MKVESISLSWFRGVGESLTLEPKGKSVVVYGMNGAGKSTFPDAIEYVINDGKIHHLSHEYSGSRLEHAVRNTHAPPDQPSVIEIQFAGGAKLGAEIAATGKSRLRAEPESVREVLSSIGLERLLLRQDEVSSFVHATKGQKYSVLLPLLGLESLEQAATNLQSLRKAVIKKTSLEQKRSRAQALEAEAREIWSSLSMEEATRDLEQIGTRYLEEAAAPEELIPKLEAAVGARARTLEREQNRSRLLRDIAGQELDQALETLLRAEEVLRERFDVLVSERIGVLEATSQFLARVDAGQTDCPACGRLIERNALSTHVEEGLAGLGAVRQAKEEAVRARGSLHGKLRRVQDILADAEVKDWLRHDPGIALAAVEIRTIDGQKVEASPDLDLLERSREPLLSLLGAMHRELRNPPPATAELFEHQRRIRAAAALREWTRLRTEIEKLDELCTLLAAAEEIVREETRTRTRAVVDSLTADIQRLWKKLHPGEQIEGIHLHVPGDADRAIDIALKFYGIEQPSPRLTLSEGHRNSLGLCIFFALALSGPNDAPVILDDIVSSLDRDHRGMLVNVLVEDFADRQVFLFTHDREWYAELRARLPEKAWMFRILRPWSDPVQGTQWLDARGGFDDARRLLEIKPEAAGNEVRKVMDVELAKIAERLGVELPFRRGDRNDHRMAHEFLQKLVSLGKTRFQRRNGGAHAPFSEATETWEECRKLLASWANRASHGGSLTRAEATQLITVSEAVLASFRCGGCNAWVWAADQVSNERLQCRCEGLRWNYG